MGAGGLPGDRQCDFFAAEERELELFDAVALVVTLADELAAFLPDALAVELLEAPAFDDDALPE